MEIQLKKTSEGAESPDLAEVKKATVALLSAQARMSNAVTKHRAEITAAEQVLSLETNRFNRMVLRSRTLHDKADWRRYQEDLSSADISRTCFVQHEGEPEDFPCMVVSVRIASTSHEQRYYHRFITNQELTQHLEEMKNGSNTASC